MDQLANQAAKIRYMFGGQIGVPMVLRTQGGTGRSAGAEHSQSLEAWVMHTPGLRLAMPATVEDVYHLLRHSLTLPDPTVFIEHKALYTRKEHAQLDVPPAPWGKAIVRRPGRDVTVATYSRMVHYAIEAAEQLAGGGIEMEVIDLRTLNPLDMDSVTGADPRVRAATGALVMGALTMPRMGETMETGRIAAWLKRPGDSFERGEIILEIETDKTTVEVPALDDGRLSEILAQEGAEVAVGEPIGRYEGVGGQRLEPPPPQPVEVAPSPSPAPRPAQNAASSVPAEVGSGRRATPVPRRQAPAIADITSNNYVMGSQTSQFMVDRLLGEGKSKASICAIIANFHHGTRKRGKVLKTVLSENDWVSLKNERVIQYTGSYETTQNTVNDWLTTYGNDLDAIWCPWDEPAMAAAEVIMSRNMQDKVFVVGVDGHPTVVDRMRKPGYPLVATVAQSFEIWGAYTGWLITKSSARAAARRRSCRSPPDPCRRWRRGSR